MRQFEKTGEKLKRLNGEWKKKNPLLFPSYYLSLSFKFKESPGCRKKKGRIDRWQEGRERQLSRQLSCILYEHLYFSQDQMLQNVPKNQST